MKKMAVGLSKTRNYGRYGAVLLAGLLAIMGLTLAVAAETDLDHCGHVLATGVPTAYDLAYDLQQGRANYLLFLRMKAYHMDTREEHTLHLAQAKSLRALVRIWSKELAMRYFLTSPQGLVLRANISRKTRRAIARHHQAFYQAYLAELAARLGKLTGFPWEIQEVTWQGHTGTGLVLRFTKNHPWPSEVLADLAKQAGPLQTIFQTVAQLYQQWQALGVPGDQVLELVYFEPAVAAAAAPDNYWRTPQWMAQAVQEGERIYLPWYIFDEGMPARALLEDALQSYLAAHR